MMLAYKLKQICANVKEREEKKLENATASGVSIPPFQTCKLIPLLCYLSPFRARPDSQESCN